MHMYIYTYIFLGPGPGPGPGGTRSRAGTRAPEGRDPGEWDPGQYVRYCVHSPIYTHIYTRIYIDTYATDSKINSSIPQTETARQGRGPYLSF